MTATTQKDGGAGSRTAPGLGDLQDAFQRAVIDGEETVLDLIPANSRTSANVLFGVYRHAYWARLAGVAASDYPRLQVYMGEAAFQDLARAYLKAHPSHTPNARWFSHRLPEFCRSTAPYSKHPELADLASLERALSGAFDAADAETATIEDLRAIPPEDWGNLVFTPHPSVRRLDHTTNAFDLWNALKSDEPPPPVHILPAPNHLIVWREETLTKVRPLGAEEAMLWDEAAKGVTFAALCELAAVYDDPDSAPLRVAQTLQGWLNGGLLAR